MVSLLEERQFPLASLKLLASPRSAGSEITFRGESHQVEVATPESFNGVDIALFSAGGEVSKTLAPLAAKAGALVIDNSSAWRMQEGVPLVVPEVNAAAIADHHNHGIIANPNCSTIQMMVSLAPLHREATLTRVVVSTYQAVSGAGKDAMDELNTQVSQVYNQIDITPDKFTKQIAFNCIPHIDTFMSDAFTREEHKMLHESRKILDHPSCDIIATCVRVPVFNSHAESIYAEFSNAISPQKAKEILRQAPGICLVDDPENGDYPVPLEANGSDATFVGRLRQAPNNPCALAFWCVADNLRKGAATNAVQIAEIWLRDHFHKA